MINRTITEKKITIVSQNPPSNNTKDKAADIAGGWKTSPKYINNVANDTAIKAAIEKDKE